MNPRQAPIRWNQLPPSIAKTLRAAVARIQRILWTRGLLATLATALISILVIMGIDAAFTIFNPVVRWALTIAGVAATAFVCYRTLVKPLSRPLTPARIASILEARHPELEERISTVVEILSSPDAAYAETLSGELFTLLSKEAEVDASKVDARDEFTNRTVKPKFYAFAAAGAVLLVLFAVAPKLVGRLFIRAVAPAAEVDNVYADSVSVAPGDTTVLLGTPLTIDLDVKGGFPGLAYVYRRALNDDGSVGPEIKERMRQLAAPSVKTSASSQEGYGEETSPSSGDSAAEETDGLTDRLTDRQAPSAPAPSPSTPSGKSSVRHYEQTIPVVTTSFKYRVNCGHALTKYYTVTAVDAPDIESLAVTFDYPAYTGREPSVFKDADVDVSVVSGTKVTWSAVFNRPDLTPHLTIPGVKVTREGRTDNSGVWTATVDESTNTTWTFFLSDKYGYTNAPVEHVFRAVPDTPPTITLDQPRQLRMRLPPHSKIPLQFTVHDDFGVSAPEIWYAVTDAATRQTATGEPVSSAEFAQLHAARVFQRMDDGAWRGVDAIDLSTLSLGKRKYFQFQLRVADNLPAELGGPHVATSSVYTVELDQSALSLSSQSINAQEKHIRQVLEEVVQRLTDSRNVSSNVLDHVRSGGILDDLANAQLADAARDTAMARSLSSKLSEEIRETMFKPFADKLQDFADHEAKVAADRAEEVPLANPQERLPAIETSENASETARARAAALLDELTDLAERLRELEKLRELAEREQLLAEMAEDIKDLEDAEMWKKLQEELEAQLKEEMAKDPETLLEQLEKREEKLKELAEEARKLAEEQEELKDLAEDLARPDKREEAEKALEEKTRDMPEDATAEERLAELEEDIAEKAEDLRQETKEMRDDLQEFGEPLDPLMEPTKNAAQNLDAGADKAEEAADDLNPKEEESAADQFADENDQDNQNNAGDQQNQDGQQNQPPSEETVQKMEDSKEAFNDAAKNLEQTMEAMQNLKNDLQQQIDENQANASDDDWPEPDYDAMENALENMEQASDQVQQFQDTMEAAQDMKDAMDAQQKAMDALEQAADQNNTQEQREKAAQEAEDWQQKALDKQEAAMEKMQDLGLDTQEQQEAMDRQEAAMEAREKAEESGSPEDWQEAMDAQQEAMNQQKEAGENFEQQTGLDPENMQMEPGEPMDQDPQQGDQQQQQDQQQGPMTPEQMKAMQEAMQKAQQQAQQAAQQMRQQAEQMAQKMDLPMMPDPNAMKDPKSAQEVLKAMTKDQSKREHAQMIPEALRGKISEEDWFKIQGDAKSGAEGGLGNVPAEYRELVREYFQALSAGEEETK